MSTTLHYRPKPRKPPPSNTAYSLKWAFANRFSQWDGSISDGPWTITMNHLEWLRGLVDGSPPGGEVELEANRLIKVVQENPQGVEVWIAD